MQLIECRNIKKYYGDKTILDIESLKIYDEDRIGIVGLNGAGKTTLIHILCGIDNEYEGWVNRKGSYSYISQLDHENYDKISLEIANKFGSSEVWKEHLSGGEKTRYKIASCFTKESNIIFADEPTSNLDIEGIELLENKLKGFRGALVITSHDRDFLDTLCNKIIELENGKIKIYNGNYTCYKQQKDIEKERELFEYVQYEREKRRLYAAIEDSKDKVKTIRNAPARMGNSEARLHKMGNQKAKANLNRAIGNIEARIEHLEEKKKPKELQKIKLEIKNSSKLYGKIIISGRNVNKYFENKLILNAAEFDIYNGSKTALIGPNGSCKTTLIKMIMYKDAAIKISQGAKIGYLSQDMDILNEELSILENVMKDSMYDETFARLLLAGLLFKREEVYKKVGVLSGGEKALKEYDKTLLFVSHDRSFVRNIANNIIEIKEGNLTSFNGTFDEYIIRKSNKHENKDEIEKQILVLENRLSELISKLSMPGRNDIVEELDTEYYKVLGQLKKLKNK
ncbi:ribosomal protection-like ABC-F family protein [Candidatus Clostridium stratigraminis]|uniref:Ribosomal protection-like ABC-F family protein n=1 Tax=Candidatus Clostridium stratigraminis TaxID=3381661 RepID=A0ABW8T336_9CLOT